MSGTGAGVGLGGAPPDPRLIAEAAGDALSWREALLILAAPPDAAADAGALPESNTAPDTRPPPGSSGAAGPAWLAGGGNVAASPSLPPGSVTEAGSGDLGPAPFPAPGAARAAEPSNPSDAFTRAVPLRPALATEASLASRPPQAARGAGEPGQQLAGSANATASPPATPVPVTAAGPGGLGPSPFPPQGLGTPPGLPLSLAAVLSSAGYAQAAGVAPRLPDAMRSNPLLDWAQASERAPPAADVLAAAQALPGPAAALLARGTDPGIALTLQVGWEAALLGGREPISGATLTPLWQAWGLPGAPTLVALVRDLGNDAPVLPQAAGPRPSERLMRLLDAKPALPSASLVQAFAASDAPTSLLLLGFSGGTAGAFAGRGLSGFAPATDGMSATGLVAVQVPAGAPLMLAQAAPEGVPAASDGLKLGDASLRAGSSDGLPWVAADTRGTMLPDAAASLTPALLAALPHAPAPITGATLSVPLGLGADWAAYGQVAFGDGRVQRFGAAPLGGLLPGGTADSEGVMSALHVGPARAGFKGDEAAFVAHGERKRIPLDVAPAQARVPCWRLDDTQALVVARPGGVGSASARAAELCGALAAEGSLGLLQPGEGFSTWEGSPLWLALAGIGKPARLGVLLHETAPGRLEVLRTPEGEWLVEHAGGGWAAPRRTRHPRHALENEALLLDVLFGLDHPAVGGPDLAGWHAARAHMAGAALLPTAEAAWRAQEAWAAVARSWAQLALLLREAAGDGTGAAAAWLASPGASLPGVQMDDRRTLVAAALRASVNPPPVAPENGGATQPVQAADALFAAVRSGNVRRVGAALPVYGAAVLERLLEGDTASIGPAEGVALAVRLGRLAPGISLSALGTGQLWPTAAQLPGRNAWSGLPDGIAPSGTARN